MRSSPLLLLLLIGQAVLNMGGGRALSTVANNHTVGQQAAANHRAGQQKTVVGDHLSEHHSSQAHQRPSHHRTRRSHRAISQAQERSPVLGHSKSVSPSDPSIPEVDPKLFSKRRFRSSSRVVFSEVPPSHEAQEGEATDAGAARGARVRRRAGMPSMHRGEYSVCDSISNWVGNRTMATDMAGNEVTVLPFVKIENVVKRQFFYETTCQSANHRVPGPSSYVGRSKGKSGKQGSRSDTSGCRGVDSKHWNSYCTNTQSFVSALTIFEKQTAWRNIRINVACVCVLTRRSWQGRVGR